MRRIVVASEKDRITEHFGHCSHFNIFDTDAGKIIKSQSVDNPGHRRRFLPKFLQNLGADVVISGSMGAGAIDGFNAMDIDVITGAKGDAEKAVLAYLAGDLSSDELICKEHEHHHSCEHHGQHGHDRCAGQ